MLYERIQQIFLFRLGKDKLYTTGPPTSESDLSMSKAIHYIGVDHLDEYQRFHAPITNDGQLQADQVVLIRPPGQDLGPGQLIEDLEEELVEEANVTVTTKEFGEWHIGTPELYQIFQFVTSDAREQISEGNEVYFNVTSKPHKVGYSFILAAHFLMLEALDDDFGGHYPAEPQDIRSQIHLYETKSHSYLGDILNDLERYDELLGDLRTHIRRQAGEIENSIEREEGFQEFVTTLSRLEESTLEEIPNWKIVSNKLDNLSPNRTSDSETFADSVDQLEHALQDLFEGLSKISKGLTNLSDDQLRREIINAPNLVQLPHHDQIVNLLNQCDDVIDQDSKSEQYSVVDGLGDNFEERLDDLRNIERRINEIEDEVEKREYDPAILNDIKDHGIAGYSSYGGSTGQNYLELVTPPTGHIGELERVLVTGLYSLGTAESIFELIEHLIWLATEVKLHESKGNDDDDDEDIHKLSELHESLVENESNEMVRELVNSFRSKIQYNLNQLEQKGFIIKEKKGRSSKIELTDVGEYWIYGNNIETALTALDSGDSPEYLTTLFDGYCEDIQKRI